LDRFGFRNTLRIWTGITAATSTLAVWLVPTHPSRTTQETPHRAGEVPWHFLRHSTIYVQGIATMLQSAGYGIPQTYFNTYAHEAAKLSQTTATLLLTLFNVPGIVASTFFGYLTTNRYFAVSATTATVISGVSSSLSAFLLWGLTSPGSMALLVLFSVTFGFFAGGYSATWGGIINEMEREAARRNEAIDTGIVYGLLNGARGLGYVTGGLAGVPLLKSGVVGTEGRFGYGTNYGPLILFTGLSSIFGGWGFLWKGLKPLPPTHRQSTLGAADSMSP
jgi:predicted MFS family arabinose efflux permease